MPLEMLQYHFQFTYTLLMSSSAKLLRVFSDKAAGAQGNLCRIETVRQELTLTETLSTTTQCSTWPIADNKFGVRCCTPGGQPIQCCGHGLLASAYAWLADQPNRRTDISLLMNESLITCQREDKLFWLSFNRIKVSFCARPEWMSAYFDDAPIRAAATDDENGYLVLEWPEDYPLRLLTPPPCSLQNDTYRALIVTALSNQDRTRIHFRYFAPQYGVPEDPGTGSAMRILSDYWQQRIGVNELTAFQCSDEGSILHSVAEGDLVKVGGSVAFVPEE